MIFPVRPIVQRIIDSFRASNACFMGLDVSLASSGIAVVDSHGRVVHVSASTSSGTVKGSVLHAGAALSTALSRVAATHTIKATVIEDFLQTFASNSSSAHTRFTLARVNGIASFEAWRYTGSPVIFAYASSMRSYFELERGKLATPLAASPPLETIVDTIAAKRAVARLRASSRANAKAGVVAFVAAANPGLNLAEGGGGGSGGATGDRADAALAAMYCFAREVELATIHADDGAIWWQGVDALLPKVRVGKTSAVKEPHLIPALRFALRGLHTSAMEIEMNRRLVPTPTITATATTSTTSINLKQKLLKSKTKTKKQEISAVADAAHLPVTISAAALERLYLRLRASFTADVKEALVSGMAKGTPPLVLWRGGV